MVNTELKDGFEFGPLNYPFYKKDAIRIITDTRPIQEYQRYINEKGIEKAIIVMPNLELIRTCPSLKYLNITPSYNALPGFDFSPLYEASEIISLNCRNIYGNKYQYISTIDYSKINNLIELAVGVNKGTLGFEKIKTLRTLRIGGYKGKNGDVSDMFCSKELDTLALIECKIQSLQGIEKATKMQCVYIHNNRSLKSIDGLRGVKETIRALQIENCPKIEDFSVLAELENLEFLMLTGNNELPDLSFIRKLKNLKTFVFNMNVKDGDLSPCLDLSYVYSERNRKHYNLKDDKLPKNQYIRGNESIEEWRRLY